MDHRFLRRLALGLSVIGLGACWTFGDGGGVGNGGTSNSAGCGASVGISSPCNDPDPNAPAAPPARSSMHREGGATRWFVLRSVRLGEATPDLSRDSCAWKSIGFDLDRRNVTADISKLSTGGDGDPKVSCHRLPGSPSAILTDGVGGIDNNFGARLVATLESFNDFGYTPDSGPPPRPLDEQVDDQLKHGSETVLLRIDNAFDDDEASAPGALFAVAALPSGSPGSTDSWPVYADSLVGSVDLARPRIVFPNGYVAGGTWVSGVANSRFEIPMTFGGSVDERIAWPIDAGLIAFRLVGGRGTLAGAMDVESLKAALTPVAAKFGICPGNATFEQIASTLRQSADLVLGAPQLQDPTRTCDALSVGIGIEMVPAKPPTTVVPRPPPVSSADCSTSDAGAKD